jgi:hypothetical protein
MDDLQLEALGFDFRGPASSEALNEFVTQMNQDIGNLLTLAYMNKVQTETLANQTIKQTYAFCRKLAEDDSRDNGSICEADITDSTIVLHTDRNEAPIDAASRFVHRHQNMVILPSTSSLSWLTRFDGNMRFVANGVTMDDEAVQETGTVYTLPLSQAISGIPAMYYEKIIVNATVPGTQQESSAFYTIPPSLTGDGYPYSNFISLMPFPMYTESMRIYYTTQASPTLTRSGSTWNDWPTYTTSLRHGGNYKTKVGPIYSSFPNTEITAIRIDMKQPYYLVESDDYVFSYGFGELEVGQMKPLSGTIKGTVRVDKPSGSFVTINSGTGGNVTFDNLPAADISDAVTTYAWIDDGDATIAYVEITINMDEISNGVVPIITNVSVDYTGTV